MLKTQNKATIIEIWKKTLINCHLLGDKSQALMLNYVRTDLLLEPYVCQSSVYELTDEM